MALSALAKGLKYSCRVPRSHYRGASQDMNSGLPIPPTAGKPCPVNNSGNVGARISPVNAQRSSVVVYGMAADRPRAAKKPAHPRLASLFPSEKTPLKVPGPSCGNGPAADRPFSIAPILGSPIPTVVTGPSRPCNFFVYTHRALGRPPPRLGPGPHGWPYVGDPGVGGA